MNVMGVFFSYKYAALQMIKQGTGGRIVGAASIASKKGKLTVACLISTRIPLRSPRLQASRDTVPTAQRSSRFAG